MKKFIEISGYLMGVLGLFLSFYFYELSKKERDPTFILEPIRTEILDAKKIQRNPIKIFTIEGKEITGNLTSVRFYFWNKGKQPIKNTDVLDSIIISTDKARIISYKILKQSRAVNKISLSTISQSSLKVDFKILEKDDGFTGEILIEGDSSSHISINGTIEEVSKFSNFPLSFYRLLGKTILYVFIGMLAISFSFLMLGGSSVDFTPRYISLKENPRYKQDLDFKLLVDTLEKNISETKEINDKLDLILLPKKTLELNSKPKKQINKPIKIFGLCCLLIIALGVAFYFTEKHIRENPTTYIPQSIRY